MIDKKESGPLDERSHLFGKNSDKNKDISLNNQSNYNCEDFTANVLSRFKVQKKSGNRYQCVCPAHEDNTASLTITDTQDNVLLYCHAGCQTSDILRAVRLDYKDLFKNDSKDNRITVSQHDYTDEKGNLAHRTYKYINSKGKKEFRQSGFVNGKEVWSLKGIKIYPYNLPKVIDAIKRDEDIYIVEGEKDADNLIKHGLTATTSPMGAGKWRDSFTKFFAGASIIIIPDNDEAGREHANMIIKSFEKHFDSPCIKVVTLPGLKEKQDVSDFLMQNTIHDLLQICINTRTYKEHIKFQEKTSEIAQEVIEERDLRDIRAEIYDEKGKIILAKVLEHLALRYDICCSLVSGKYRYYIYQDGYWQERTMNEVGHLFVNWFYVGSQKPSTIENVVKLMHSKPEFNVSETQFNSKLHLINLKNCTFNLDTFAPEPHDPKHYFTYKTPYDYDESAQCPIFKESLKLYSSSKQGTIKNWENLFWEIAGYCLRGDMPFQKMFWFTGSKGRNGKGTCVRVIENLVGDLFTISDIDTRDLRERFYKLRLKGKRLATTGDLHNRLANVATLKQLTGGDRQTTDVKFGDAVTFTNQAKLIFAMNQLPVLPENENIVPIAKRIVILPFEAEIAKPDTQIEAKINAELSGIFNEAIIGLQRVMMNREFTETERGNSILELYADNKPPIDLFIEDNYIYQNGQSKGIFLHEIFENYQKFMNEAYGSEIWRNDRGNLITNSFSLSEYLKKHFFSQGKILATSKKYCPKKQSRYMYFENLSDVNDAF